MVMLATEIRERQGYGWRGFPTIDVTSPLRSLMPTPGATPFFPVF